MQFESFPLPGNVVHIKLRGRLDIEGAQSIDTQFSYATTADTSRIVVDLAEVSFLASIGIRLLLTSARAQIGRGGRLVLAAPQPAVLKVLESAGIDQLVEIHPDVEQARLTLAG